MYIMCNIIYVYAFSTTLNYHTVVYLLSLTGFHSLNARWHKYILTHKLEMHGCVFSIVATDALVLKHQPFCIPIVLGSFNPKYYLTVKIIRNEN